MGNREDLISSMDALHEDMYFVGSDYFKNDGIRKADVIFDAPGLILPKIHVREEAPAFKVTTVSQAMSVSSSFPAIPCRPIRASGFRDHCFTDKLLDTIRF